MEQDLRPYQHTPIEELAKGALLPNKLNRFQAATGSGKLWTITMLTKKIEILYPDSVIMILIQLESNRATFQESMKRRALILDTKGLNAYSGQGGDKHQGAIGAVEDNVQKGTRVVVLSFHTFKEHAVRIISDRLTKKVGVGFVIYDECHTFHSTKALPSLKSILATPGVVSIGFTANEIKKEEEGIVEGTTLLSIEEAIIEEYVPNLEYTELRVPCIDGSGASTFTDDELRAATKLFVELLNGGYFGDNWSGLVVADKHSELQVINKVFEDANCGRLVYIRKNMSEAEFTRTMSTIPHGQTKVIVSGARAKMGQSHNYTWLTWLLTPIGIIRTCNPMIQLVGRLMRGTNAHFVSMQKPESWRKPITEALQVSPQTLKQASERQQTFLESLADSGSTIVRKGGDHRIDVTTIIGGEFVTFGVPVSIPKTVRSVSRTSVVPEVITTNPERKRSRFSRHDASENETIPLGCSKSNGPWKHKKQCMKNSPKFACRSTLVMY